MLIESAEQLAQVLRSTRLEQGVTQGGLAASIGVTRQAVANVEAGRTVPSVALVLAALAALGLRVDVHGQDGASPATARERALGPVDLDALLTDLVSQDRG